MLMDKVWFEQVCFLTTKSSFSVKMKVETGKSYSTKKVPAEVAEAFSEDFASIELFQEG